MFTRARLAVGIGALLVLSACAPAVGVRPPASPAPVIPARYTGPAVTGPENVTLLYQSLAETEAAGQLVNVGHPRDLVFGAKNDAVVPGSASEVAYAHSIGARAIKYAQVTWFPALSNTWLGTTGVQRTNWALCRNGSTPLTDADDGDGSSHGSIAWHYADTNERAYANAVLSWTAGLKALGYDGVFIDAAGRTLRGPNWNVASSCTEDPVTPGARASDAWFRLVMAIKAQGLQVGAMNIGDPDAADPFTRPDPNRPSQLKNDVLAFDWILHENAGRPLENYPGATPAATTFGAPFDQLVTRIRNDARTGRAKVVEMAKARLPLADPNRLRQEEYVWALGKLAGGPVVLNAGFDFCGVPAGTDDCNRTGLSGALTDLRLGTPIDATPYATFCTGASCMWVRRFERGLVAVSAYGTPRRVVTVPLGTAGCRSVTAFQGGPQAAGTCVTSLTVETGSPRWSHVFLYAP